MRRSVIPILLLSILLLCGCGGGQKEALKAGEEAYLAGDFAEAREQFQTAIKNGSGKRIKRRNAAANRFLGIMAWEEKDFESAIPYFQEASTQSDDNDFLLDVFRYLGDCLEQTGQEEEAILIYTRALEREKDESISCRRAYLQVKTGQISYDDAASVFSKAVEKGTWEGAYFDALTLEETGEYGAAIETFQEALAMEGAPVSKIYQRLVACCLQINDTENALSLCDMGYTFAKEEGEKGQETAGYFLWNKVSLLEETCDYVGAYETAKEYAALFPSDEKMQHELIFLSTRVKEESAE